MRRRIGGSSQTEDKLELSIVESGILRVDILEIQYLNGFGESLTLNELRGLCIQEFENVSSRLG
jgi:hypothetical protein